MQVILGRTYGFALGASMAARSPHPIVVADHLCTRDRAPDGCPSVDLRPSTSRPPSHDNSHVGGVDIRSNRHPYHGASPSFETSEAGVASLSFLVVEAFRLEIFSLTTPKEHAGSGRNFLPSQRYALPTFGKARVSLLIVLPCTVVLTSMDC